jgi:hypothetical protein
MDLKDAELCRWEAPEVIRNHSFAGSEPAMVYALGMIVVEVLTGQVPLSDLSATEVTELALSRTEPPPIMGDGPMWDLARRCIATSADARPSLEEVINALTALVPGLVEMRKPPFLRSPEAVQVQAPAAAIVTPPQTPNKDENARTSVDKASKSAPSVRSASSVPLSILLKTPPVDSDTDSSATVGHSSSGPVQIQRPLVRRKYPKAQRSLVRRKYRKAQRTLGNRSSSARDDSDGIPDAYPDLK